MIYSYHISLLWVCFGFLSWVVGRAGQNLGLPRSDTLAYLNGKNMRVYVVPPEWAAKLCALSKEKVNVLTAFFFTCNKQGHLYSYWVVFLDFLSPRQPFGWAFL
ncbi:MAG: hypothetical protein EHM20_14625 [Alphaproteobacteria bacterium]|nr:MAG: hypothetical protein EHM20_14625 [Alphaproteobacteria bacterium]